jgi:hypothetical protein
VLIGPNGSTTLVAVVADGAGSAARADEASRLACAGFVEQVRAFVSGGGRLAQVDRHIAATWLQIVAAILRDRAEEEGRAVRDFASTLIAALVDDAVSIYIQVGDGCMVVAGDGVPQDYCWIFWPDNGEYINQTYFLTDQQMIDRFLFERANSRVGRVAVFSDGLQPIALHFASKSVHAGFFTPMFAALENLPNGFLLGRSDALAAFLGSERVNSRTDDDKSLVLARRD